MEYLFGAFRVAIDVEKTRAFYRQAEYITSGCQCDGCCNYEKAVDFFPQKVKEFFDELGIDLKKAAEIIAYIGECEGKKINYGGFYHLCGTMLSDTEVWVPMEDAKLKSMSTDMYKIIEGYEIGFTNGCSLVEEDFPRPILQMEISFHCPWVLEKENPYMN